MTLPFSVSASPCPWQKLTLIHVTGCNTMRRLCDPVAYIFGHKHNILCCLLCLCLYLAFSGCDCDTIRGADLRWCYRLHAGRVGGARQRKAGAGRRLTPCLRLSCLYSRSREGDEGRQCCDSSEIKSSLTAAGKS